MTNNNPTAEDYKLVLEELNNKEILLQHLMEEKERSEYLDFSWTGNLGQWYWNVKSNEVKFNPLKIKALGFSLDDVPKKIDYQFFTERLHKDDYEPVMQNMRDHLYGKSNVYECEYRIKAKDGSYKWFYDRGKITKRDAENKPELLVGIVFDITEKKFTEAKMQELIIKLGEEINLKEILFSIIVHDLKNPLGNIIGFSELVVNQLSEKESESAKQKVQIINKEAKEAILQLSDLSNWMRSTLANEVELTEFNLSDLFDKLNIELKENLDQKNIRIQTSFSNEASIYSNKEITKIILRNFINNAIKYSKKNSIINLSFGITAETAVVTVEDSGIGMSESTLEKLFKTHLYSIPGTNEEVGQGIGLMICQSLARKIGAELKVESELNTGSKFSIIFKREKKKT